MRAAESPISASTCPTATRAGTAAAADTLLPPERAADGAPVLDSNATDPHQVNALAALRRYVALHGHLLTLKQRIQGLPSPPTVRQLFGSWHDYVRAAGFTPRPSRVWSEHDVIPALNRWASQHGGQAPGRAQWSQDAPTRPSYRRVQRLFGTWSAAIHEAGLSPHRAKPRRWTDEAILHALQHWAQKHDVPRARDWIDPGDDHPTRALVTRRFGSWNAALFAAGLKPPATEPRWSPEHIIAAMQAWARAHHRAPARSTGDTRPRPSKPGPTSGNDSAPGRQLSKPQASSRHRTGSRW